MRRIKTKNQKLKSVLGNLQGVDILEFLAINESDEKNARKLVLVKSVKNRFEIAMVKMKMALIFKNSKV